MICVTRRAELCILYSRLRASVREVWRDGREMTRAHQSGHGRTHTRTVCGWVTSTQELYCRLYKQECSKFIENRLSRIQGWEFAISLFHSSLFRSKSLSVKSAVSDSLSLLFFKERREQFAIL